MRTSNQLRTNVESLFFETLSQGRYAFLHVGSDIGAPLAFCENRFKRGSGLSILNSPSEVNDIPFCSTYSLSTPGNGEQNIPKKCVSFCSMMDCVEHLPSVNLTVKLLKLLSETATDFLFIRQPSFENSEYLAKHNLKLSWSDWTSHTNQLSINALQDIFDSIGFDDYIIIPRMQFIDSNPKAFVPLSAPSDTIQYRPELHGPKNLVIFKKPVFGQFDIFIKLNRNMSETEWKNIILDSVEPLKPTPTLVQVALLKVRRHLLRNRHLVDIAI